MNIKLSNDVLQIILELNNRGYEAYIVGGCVRDSILGDIPKDWDITTNATPNDMRAVFENYYLIPTGEKYGTMTVILNNVPYEITTYRAEGNYSDGRRPDNITFSKTLKEDLCRRDLTINAMAYHPDIGLIDYFDGYEDLKNKSIRCVGNAITRFNEDALRIMRAIRLAVCLDFDISKETLNAIWECGEKLINVSQERKRDELIKILKGIKNLNKNTSHYTKIYSMVEYIIKRIIPEFQDLAQIAHNSPYHYTDVITHTIEMLFIADTDDIEILLTILFHDIGKMKARIFDEKRLTNHFYNHPIFSVELAKDIMKRLRFDNKTIERVLNLIEYHDFIIKADPKCAKKLLNKLGLDLCLKLLQFQILDKAIHRWNYKEYEQWVSDTCEIKNIWYKILKDNEAFKISDLDINGNDLREIGIPEGKEIGEILAKCLEYIINNPDKNNKAEIIEYVKHIVIL